MSRAPMDYQGVNVRENVVGYESAADSLTVAQFFNMVYAWMCVGLALTAVVGWYVAHSSIAPMIYGSRGSYFLVALVAFGIAWYVQSQVAG